MTDKFPEAFDRFEEQRNIDNIKTFQQLFMEFQAWGKKFAPMTQLQTSCLKKEGQERDIGLEKVQSRKGQTIYRQMSNKRFVSKEDYNKYDMI